MWTVGWRMPYWVAKPHRDEEDCLVTALFTEKQGAKPSKPWDVIITNLDYWQGIAHKLVNVRHQQTGTANRFDNNTNLFWKLFEKRLLKHIKNKRQSWNSISLLLAHKDMVFFNDAEKAFNKYFDLPWEKSTDNYLFPFPLVVREGINLQLLGLWVWQLREGTFVARHSLNHPR